MQRAGTPHTIRASEIAQYRILNKGKCMLLTGNEGRHLEQGHKQRHFPRHWLPG